MHMSRIHDMDVLRLHEVDMVEMLYPSLGYVVKRLMLKMPIGKIVRMEGVPYTSDLDLHVGDILLWIKDLVAPRYQLHQEPDWGYVNLHINRFGVVSTYANYHIGRRYGVYEGDGYTSILTYRNKIPYIQMLAMAEKPAPRVVIPWSTLFPGSNK